MKKNKRFIQAVLSEAKTKTPKLPWERGARRAAFVAKRSAPQTRLKSA